MALQLFYDMALIGIGVDPYGAVVLLSRCGHMKNTLLGRSVMAQYCGGWVLADRGFILSNALLHKAGCSDSGIICKI